MFFKQIICALLLACAGIHTAFALPLNDDLKKIVADGKLTVAFVSTEATPYVYHDAQGKLQGFDVELATRIAKALGVQLDPVFSPNYNEAIALVANKKAELAISNITRTYERGKYVLFSQPYNSGYLTVIESRQNATAIEITRNKMIEKYNQKGFIMGVQEGTVFAEFVEKYLPLARAAHYTNDKQMLLDIDNKKINAAITDYIIARSLLIKSPEVSLSVTTTRVNNWILQDAITMHKDNLNLTLWINLFLETLEQDGTLNQMRIHYFKAPT